MLKTHEGKSESRERIVNGFYPDIVTWIPATHNEDGGLKPSFS